MKMAIKKFSRDLVGHCLLFLFVCIQLIHHDPAHAGDHWLSRVRVKHPSKAESIIPAKQLTSTRPLPARATSSTAVFDITISLEENPQGDDDWTTDNGSDDAAQRKFEERIKAFARAVYQSTNGGHQIGTVTIYRDGASASSTDVLWRENCPADEGPQADISGFGKAGWQILMCTNWPGSSTMDEANASGYTLAHEWGHYTYGLFDEYAQEQCDAADIAAGTCHRATPRATDTASVPAIMNNQWIAARGTAPSDYSGGASDFLEHSTRNVAPYQDDSTGTNAQKRVYGESAWETLTSDPATDPKFKWLPTRTQYTTLTAPTDPNWLVSNDESNALGELNIRWVGDDLLDLSIDVSTSMRGTPLANAKTGANLLIDQLQPGTAVGVSSFSTSVARNFAITTIPDPDTGVVAAAKDAVNDLRVIGLTSMYDGLMLSLTDLQAFDANRTGIVYVLSDGYDNDSTATRQGVIAAYQAAGVPIIAFAYGSGAPTGALMDLASSTGGAFYQSPTTLPEIQAALIAAQTEFSDNVLLTSAKSSIAEGTSTRTIPIDSTLASVTVNLSYTGEQSDFEFYLLRPDGLDSGAAFNCEGSTSCSASLDETFFTSNGYGDYQVQMVNTTGSPVDVTALVSAAPAVTETFDIAVRFSSITVDYPSAMTIHATVTQGGIALSGLDLTAILTDPSGASSTLALFDDGVGADMFADDGTYSANFFYAQDGNYSAVVTARNTSGSAQTTFVGSQISLQEDGTAPPAPTPQDITENFTRTATASASASGVLADDHADDVAGGACTLISDDNTDTPGRIDIAGDMDCFTIVPSSTDAPLVLRVTTLSADMDPVLTVYDRSGSTQIAQVDLDDSENPDSGAILTLSADLLDASGLVFVVSHANEAAAGGSYDVSAGAPLTSDVKATDTGDDTDTDTDTGGGGGDGGGGGCFLDALF